MSKSKIPLPKDIKKWTRALRSGRYAQTTRFLENENGFCCLGVLCDITIPKSKRDLDEYGYIEGGNVDEQDNAPYWAKHVSEVFENKTGVSLDLLNDSGLNKVQSSHLKLAGNTYIDRLSFDEIADLLEAVFVHKVL